MTKSIVNNIGQMSRIFPIIGKMLKVCDGACVLDLRETTQLFDFLPPLSRVTSPEIFDFGIIILCSTRFPISVHLFRSWLYTTRLLLANAFCRLRRLIELFSHGASFADISFTFRDVFVSIPEMIASSTNCAFSSHVSLFLTRSAMLTFSKYKLRVTL